MKLKAFKSRLLEHAPDGKLCVCTRSCLISAELYDLFSPRLYFVKVDVQACFDTIEQSKLLEIIKDAISEVSGPFCKCECIYLIRECRKDTSYSGTAR